MQCYEQCERQGGETRAGAYFMDYWFMSQAKENEEGLDAHISTPELNPGENRANCGNFAVSPCELFFLPVRFAVAAGPHHPQEHQAETLS